MKHLAVLFTLLITLLPLTFTASAAEIPTLDDNQAVEMPLLAQGPSVDAEIQPPPAEEDADTPKETPVQASSTAPPNKTAAIAPLPRVTELVIASAIIDREPVETGIRFSADTQRLYCHSRVASLGATTITHVWYRNGEKMATIPLNIGAASAWRTWSSKTITAPTAAFWRVEIISEAGSLLAQTDFTVK